MGNPARLGSGEFRICEEIFIPSGCPLCMAQHTQVARRLTWLMSKSLGFFCCSTLCPLPIEIYRVYSRYSRSTDSKLLFFLSPHVPEIQDGLCKVHPAVLARSHGQTPWTFACTLDATFSVDEPSHLGPLFHRMAWPAGIKTYQSTRNRQSPCYGVMNIGF